MSAIKGVSLTPASSGLNARAAAGVDIAHQVLEKSSAMNPLGVYVRTAMDPLKDKGTLTEAVDKDVEKMKLQKEQMQESSEKSEKESKKSEVSEKELILQKINLH